MDIYQKLLKEIDNKVYFEEAKEIFFTAIARSTSKDEEFMRRRGILIAKTQDLFDEWEDLINNA